MSARFHRALERAQQQLQAQRARWHAFLRDQGFHLGAEDCMPDPPGYCALAEWRHFFRACAGHVTLPVHGRQQGAQAAGPERPDV